MRRTEPAEAARAAEGRKGSFEGEFAPFTIKFHLPKTGRTHEELSLIAVRPANDSVAECGSACERYIRLPEEGVAVFCPFKRGVVADFDLAATMLKCLRVRYGIGQGLLGQFLKPRTVLCFPQGTELTQVEQVAYRDCLLQAGFGRHTIHVGGIETLSAEELEKLDVAIGITYGEPQG